jgi:hypothetical protein
MVSAEDLALNVSKGFSDIQRVDITIQEPLSLL